MPGPLSVVGGVSIHDPTDAGEATVPAGLEGPELGLGGLLGAADGGLGGPVPHAVGIDAHPVLDLEPGSPTAR